MPVSAPGCASLNEMTMPVCGSWNEPLNACASAALATSSASSAVQTFTILDITTSTVLRVA